MPRFVSLLPSIGLLLAVSSVWGQVPEFRPSKAEVAQADLFMALANGKIAGVKAAIDAGANPNEPDFIDMEPLFFAGDVPTAKLLLARGAHLNAVTVKGTALLNVLLVGADNMGIFYLDRGADPNATRTDRLTTLMCASGSGCLKSMKRLLESHLDVNAKSKDGATALDFAVRTNQLDAARILISAGANTNATDALKRTPLHYAALRGYSQMAKLLIAHGASVNAIDKNHATPLHLAAHYLGDGQMARLLVAAGANKGIKDSHEKTAFALAAQRNFFPVCEALGGSKPVASSSVAVSPATVAAAVKPSLVLIERSMDVFQQRAACVACHHQGLGVMTLAHAGEHGMSIDGKLLGDYMKQMAEDGKASSAAMHAAAVDPSQQKMIPVVHLGDFSYGGGYFIGAMHTCGVPANPGFADGALLLSQFQKPDGSWESGNRGIMQHSDMTNTAMVLDVVQSYWPADKKAELDKCVSKAKSWVLTKKASCAEDLAGRLLALKASGGSTQEIQSATTLLLNAQRADGGWGVPDTKLSDAYTTGLSLYALRRAASLPTTDASISRTVAFLLRTQDVDGSWYEAKTTPAFNNYFDAAFPHGYDQYASFAGTCWATIGLMEMLPNAPHREKGKSAATTSPNR